MNIQEQRNHQATLLFCIAVEKECPRIQDPNLSERQRNLRTK